MNAKPITVTRSNTGVLGWNPTGGKDVYSRFSLLFYTQSSYDRLIPRPMNPANGVQDHDP
jgi:hypothetical protein